MSYAEPYATGRGSLSGRMPCEFCKEQISHDASVCPFCSRDLFGSNKGEIRIADRSARRGIGILLFIVLAQLVILLAIITH